MRYSIFRTLSFGNVFHDHEQILRLSMLVVDHELSGHDTSKPAARRVHRVLIAREPIARLQYLLVTCDDTFGFRRWEEILHGPANQLVARQADKLLGGSIDQHVPA